MTVRTTNFDPEIDFRLKCTCGCGGYDVKQWALDKLQAIRDDAGRPLRVNSGYRCANHPQEVTKEKPGTHHDGIAFDIAVSNGAERHNLIALAVKHGATGIGVAKTFVHIDFRKTHSVAWPY